MGAQGAGAAGVGAAGASGVNLAIGYQTLASDLATMVSAFAGAHTATISGITAFGKESLNQMALMASLGQAITQFALGTQNNGLQVTTQGAQHISGALLTPSVKTLG